MYILHLPSHCLFVASNIQFRKGQVNRRITTTSRSRDIMAEETFQHIPWLVSQPRNRQTSTNSSSTASVPSLAIEAKTTTSTKPLSPSRPSPLSKTTPTSPTEKPRGVVKRTSKTASLGSRDGLSRPSTGTMNDLAGEVTYTPTTHRISKAKKGKKVHACEYPGCPKVRLSPKPPSPN